MSGHTSYQEIRDKRKAKFLAQDPVEYRDGPVYDDDRDQYYPDLQSCVEARWDDGDTYEDALVFECYVDPASTPSLVDYVDECWGDEIGDWDGMGPAAEKILSEAELAISKYAPIIWYPDYKRRLVFDYSGFPEVE